MRLRTPPPPHAAALRRRGKRPAEDLATISSVEISLRHFRLLLFFPTVESPAARIPPQSFLPPLRSLPGGTGSASPSMGRSPIQSHPKGNPGNGPQALSVLARVSPTGIPKTAGRRSKAPEVKILLNGVSGG